MDDDERARSALGERGGDTAVLRIALLHVAPRHDGYEQNVAALEHALALAARFRPDLVMTPELAVSGYEFWPLIGLDWVRERGSELLHRFAQWSKEHEAALVLGLPRHYPDRDSYYNSLLFIDERGRVLGEHRKIAVLPGSEGWSNCGGPPRVVQWRDQRIGLLTCADAYSPSHAAALHADGASVLLSAAAWGPGLHAPQGEWEQRAQETGLTVIVCNRTGRENQLSFEGSASVLISGGRRVLQYDGIEPALLVVDVDAGTWLPIQDARRFVVVPLAHPSAVG